MVAKAKGQQQPDNIAEWLEAELRETKARLHKVESELDQSLKQVWSFEKELRRLAEALNASGSAVSQLSAMREQLRQVHDLMGRIQDRQQAIANRTEEVLRQRQNEMGKDKQQVGDLAKQVEAMARSLAQYDARVQQLEESLRRAEDEIAGAKLSHQGLARDIEDLAGRSNRGLETLLRLEQQMASQAGAMESLRKIDEAVEDKVRLLLEQNRRLSERLDKVEDVASFPEEARELLTRATAEREQMAQRLAIMEKITSELAERLQRFGADLGKVEQRQQVESAQIMDLTGRVQETAEVLEGEMKRLRQLLLRQRRRQMDTLAQEIKELGHGELGQQQ